MLGFSTVDVVNSKSQLYETIGSGEVVKLFVVKGSEGLSEQDLIEHCRANLTGYKVPKHIEFRSELPKTNVGKILRRKLREGA